MPSALASTFDHAELRQRYALCLPPFGHGNQLVAIDIDDLEYGNPRNAAHLVECPARRRVDQPFVGHVLQQRLQRNLVAAIKAKGACDFPLSCGFFRTR